MKDYGQVPGGKIELQLLLYPFQQTYPHKLWSKYRWLQNSRLPSLLPHLNKKRKWLTVIDRLGAPGDAIITANVTRCIKEKYSNLKINCITPHPELISLDPNIDSINQPETFYSFDSTYWELIVRKENDSNIIDHNLKRLGIKKYEYKANFYLQNKEKDWAQEKVSSYKKPLIAICTKSKESVKNWLTENWIELINLLKSKFTILHLGDDKEPFYEDVHRFAGKFTIRESAAILSTTKLFIGPDSLLMHIANGLDISSVIIFGGSRPIKSFGYSQNINLSTSPECSPCWIHDGYEKCNHNIKCLSEISVSKVIKSVQIMQNNQLDD